MNKETEDLIQSALVTSPHSAEVPSAWIGHIPFASWIVRKTKPNVFVELGTHWGHSYFSVCDSVKNGNLNTVCYAVDTWEGDEHAGEYDNRVHESVNDYNDKNFKEFSHLIKSDFDNACSRFSEQSIDLLHIDGLHTYEAVKHDFQNWLPKMTNNGFVMLHDICVVKKDFGVWKFWEELKLQYPLHLEFTHCHGLGVICINTNDVKNYEWIDPSSDECKLIKQNFEKLGIIFQEKVENENLKNFLMNENKSLYIRIAALENRSIRVRLRRLLAMLASIFAKKI